MFKVRASLLFAIMSFLIVIIAGLLKDVRFVTIVWRSLLAFLVAGGLAYLTVFVLEFKGIIDFDKLDYEETLQEIDEEIEENKDETEGEEGEAEEETESAEQAESGGFAPLNTDKIERVAS
ncbi:MAG: hypothetical protein IKN43_10535 [Selenomonadaceae bacterium]|nr:hypothetical protein [Selenomonadaceae bacterium]